MQKNRYIIFMYFLFTNQLFGQTVIEGALKSTTNEPLPAVSIIAYDFSKSNILAYAFSDASGAFKVSFKHSGNKIYICTKSLSARDTSLLLDNKSQKINIILPEELNEIEEVQVSGYPINERGDTIIYTVKSFAHKKDISIEDVIKRMPGFDLTPSGQIKYQGRKIEKYYIEGLDLLENRYSIANKNLPHKAVTSVEVLQNHEPIKMLRGKTFANGTSLNIRLGKKVNFIGTMYVGGGFSPFLYDVNLSPMIFAKKQQMIASVQANNIGNDLGKQFKPVFSSSGFQGLQNMKDELVSISSIFNPPIEQERYLQNNAILLTYNHLIKLGEDFELKINTSYYKDIIDEKNTVNRTFFTLENNFVISEQTENKYYNNSMYTELSLMQNANNKYVKNKLTFNNYWDEAKGLIQNPKTINQFAKTPHQSLSNNLELYLPVKKHFINFHSFIDYNNSPQSISFSPGVFKKELNENIDYKVANQNFTKQNIITENHFSFYYKKRNWSFNSKLGFDYERQNIETSIKTDQQKLSADSLNNDLNWDYYNLYFNEKIEYKKNDFYLTVNLPIKQLFYQINDTYHTSNSDLQKTIVTPSVHLRKDISNYWNARFSVNYISSIETPEQLMQGYLIDSYRKISKKAAKIPEKQGFGYFAGLEYKHPITGFFSNLRWYSNYVKRNLLNKYINRGNGVWYYDAIEKENNQISHSLSLELKQFVAKIHSSFGLVLAYHYHKREFLSDNIIKNNNINTYSATPSVSISVFRWCDIGYNYSFKLTNQANSNKSFDFIDQKHRGDISFNFSAQQQLGFALEYYETSSENEKSSTFFSDLSYFYKPKKSKFRFRLKCNNIFNQTEYSKYFNSDIYMSKSVYQIRPQQFILTVFYNL